MGKKKDRELEAKVAKNLAYKSGMRADEPVPDEDPEEAEEAAEAAEKEPEAKRGGKKKKKPRGRPMRDAFASGMRGAEMPQENG